MTKYDLHRLLGMITHLEECFENNTFEVFDTISNEITSDNCLVEYIVEKSTTSNRIRLLLKENNPECNLVLFLFYRDTLKSVILKELEKGI